MTDVRPDGGFGPLSALPYIRARQELHREWLQGRSDRFSQLLAGSWESEFQGRYLGQQGILSEQHHQEVLELAASAANESRDELAGLIEALRRDLSILDPFAVLANLSFRNVFGTWGSYHEPSHPGSEHVIEIVAGLLLTQNAPSVPGQPTADEVAVVESRASEIFKVAHHLNVARSIAEFAVQRDESVALKHSAASHWMTIRGESYVHHARDLTVRMFGPIEAWMRAEFGFSVAEFFATFDSLERLLLDRVNVITARLEQQIRTVAPTKRPQWAAARLTTELPDALTFDAAEVATASDGVSEDAAMAILQALSQGVGSLEPSDYAGPYDGNPLAEKPFLQFGGKYQLPVPGHLVRAPYGLFERTLLGRRPGFSRHRARVLDEVAIELLQDALPGSVAAGPVYYTFDDGNGEERYEADGALIFQGYFIGVEGKAGSMSVPAMRGDLRRVEQDLRRSMAEAWAQCSRLTRFVASGDGVAEFTTEAGRSVLAVDRSTVHATVMVNPMLHSPGIFAFQVPALRRLGLTTSEVEPWTVLITDLRVIVEMVRTPAELLHYIEWRQGLPVGDDAVVIDELDVFGAYLFGSVGNVESLDGNVFFGNSTTDFDAYYAGEMGDGPVRERPHRVLGALLEDRVVRLGSDRPRRWIEQSFALLDLPLEEAAAIEASLSTRAAQDINGHDWVGYTFGGTTLIVLARGVEWIDVALEVASVTSRRKRLIVGRLTADGGEIIWSERSRR